MIEPTTSGDALIRERKRGRRNRIIIIIIGLVLIALLQLVNCNREADSLKAYNAIKDTLQSVLSDTSRIWAIARAYKKDAEDMDFRYADLLEEKKILHREVIEKSNEANRLIAEVKKAKATKDTVELVKKCDSLADATASLIRKTDSLVSVERKKDSSFALQKAILQSQINHFEKAYSDCVKTVEWAAAELPKIKPVDKVYFDITGMTGAISAAGGGLGYMNKNGLILNADVLISRHGNIYQLRMAAPLSFKKIFQ